MTGAELIAAACGAMLIVAGCRAGGENPPAQHGKAGDTSSLVIGALPPIGLAVADSAGSWCGEFVTDSSKPALAEGRAVTIVFAGRSAIPYLSARVSGPHEGECPAAFPQGRWAGYSAYQLDPVDSPSVTPVDLPIVALVFASVVPWVRDADEVVRADVDGDGSPEEVRRCTADEGEHFTVWSLRPGNEPVRRWHEYFDWGGMTDPTCRPGEDGLPTASTN